MACLELTITPVAQAQLTASPVEQAVLTVEPVQPAELSADTADDGARLTAMPVDEGAQLTVTPVEGVQLTIGEVCSVSGGTIVVLAASDGPLRTRDGGYFLLNPATNPPEN